MMRRHSLKIDTQAESTWKGREADFIEKRKNARVSIYVPISCESVDCESKPLDHNMGIIRDVSQTGVGIETNIDVSSDRLLLAFVDLNNNIAEIAGKVVFSKQTSCRTFKIGVQFQANQLDIMEFIKKLVRVYNNKKKKR
jgi:hypothetical protein